MTQENPYIKKTDNGHVVTPEGEALLAEITTNPTGPVYAFTEKAPQLLVATAMARLSRRGDDLRTIYLDEFAAVSPEHAADVMDRVVTQYGDDSVQQLSTLSFVVEDASNLLTKILEWGRLMAYLEQSTRYIFFDSTDAKGKYKYFTPELPNALRVDYTETMDKIFGLYSEVVRGLTEHVRQKSPEPPDRADRIAWLGATRAQACDAARPLLPVATKSTVGIVGTAQAVESLVRHLFASPLPEAQETGRRVLEEARKVMAAFLKRADLPERGLAWALYMSDTAAAVRKLAQSHLPAQTDTPLVPVTLLDYRPHDELELVADMLFRDAQISTADIKAVVAKLSREEQEEIFKAYVGNRLNRRHKPGRAIEDAHYKFEVVGDYGTFRDLQRHRMVDAWEWQDLVPFHGYDVPELVIQSGFENQFRTCFSLSETLYEKLAAHSTDIAQYAVLLGHKMRYRFMINAREAFHMLELRTSPQGHPGYRKICLEMHRLLAEVHPRLGGAMIFVNKKGDPELTRLEAERATQMKLRLLDEQT